MSLHPGVQTAVDQIVKYLGFPSGMQPIGLDIDMDDKGLVQRVEPRLRFSAKKQIDSPAQLAQDLATRLESRL